jgi:hypothetical protein
MTVGFGQCPRVGPLRLCNLPERVLGAASPAVNSLRSGLFRSAIVPALRVHRISTYKEATK